MQAKSKETNSLINLYGTVILIFLILALPLDVSAATESCHFIQIGSFSKDQNAAKLVDKYADFDENAVVREVHHSRYGYLYQVFVGPFDSWKEADSHKLVLRKKGIFLEDAFILKFSDPVLCGSFEHKSAPLPYHQNNSQDQKQAKSASVQKEVREAQPAEVKESQQAEVTQTNVKPQSAPEELPVEQTFAGPAVKLEKAAGRNVKSSHLAIALHHTSGEYKTNLEQRFLTISDGTSIATGEIDTNTLINTEFYTQMHRTTLRLLYGMTDTLEIFADLGAAYNQTSTLNLTYGGGANWNIFQIDGKHKNRYYGTLTGEAAFGSIEYEFDDDNANRWNKEADWQEFSARFEIGSAWKKFTIYAGGAYTYYSEDANLYLMNNLPATIIYYKYEDDYSADSNLGAFGGLDYHFTEQVKLNLEGQAGNPKELTGTLQYEF